MPTIEDTMTRRIEPYLLGLAGEYRVCSELNRRGILATVTYGNRKSVDVYAIGDRSQPTLKIEVKTTQGTNFVTGITQKGLDRDPTAPDFWVLVQFTASAAGEFTDRFFVLTHDEICAVQAARNREYARKYREKHLRDVDFSVGVDNVLARDVKQHEGGWAKIVARFTTSCQTNRNRRHNTRLHPTGADER